MKFYKRKLLTRLIIMFHLKLVTCVLVYFLIGHGHFVVDESTLKQVHIVFRHGERTPSLIETYPNDPYTNMTYYPYGRGELTNNGKTQEYTLGLNLKRKYSKFLGDIYTSDILEARSSDYTRTKMSVQLVLAALWPPRSVQKWNDQLNWQPIPHIYEKIKQDYVLRFPYHCENMNEEYETLFSLPEVKDTMIVHQWMFDYVNKHTGLNISRPIDMFILYFTLASQESVGLTLPEWSKMVYPYALSEMVILEYKMRTYTHHMMQYVIGGLIKKIRNDITSNVKGNKATKLYLYSAHELTVAVMMMALDFFYPHVPNYGSYVAVELHIINKQYGIQLFYSEYYNSVPAPIVMPGCNHFCPLENFFKITEKLMTDTVVECL